MSDYIDCKERIASIIFDHDYREGDERPSELTAHMLAEEIIEYLNPEEFVMACNERWG